LQKLSINARLTPPIFPRHYPFEYYPVSIRF